jgi:hypothetical protein
MRSTEWCVRDFGTKRPNDYMLMADHCKVQSSTALAWFEGERLPMGENLVMLRYFLELCGYKVSELERLSPAAYNLGAIIGYGILTSEEVRRILGYSRSNGVHLVVLQGKTVMPDRLYKLERLYVERAEEANIMRELLTEQFSVSSAEPSAAAQQINEPASTPTAADEPQLTLKVLSFAVRSVEAVNMLLEAAAELSKKEFDEAYRIIQNLTASKDTSEAGFILDFLGILRT